MLATYQVSALCLLCLFILPTAPFPWCHINVFGCIHMPKGASSDKAWLHGHAETGHLCPVPKGNTAGSEVPGLQGHSVPWEDNAFESEDLGTRG